MDELLLLRDYVTSMQREIQSKNNQLRTLTQQNDRLHRQIDDLSKKLSSNIKTECLQCSSSRWQLNKLQRLCTQLQMKYDNLQRIKSTQSRSSFRVLSSSVNAICTDCSRSKLEVDTWRTKNGEIQRQLECCKLALLQLKNSSLLPIKCDDCPRLRNEIRVKDEVILSLRSQETIKQSKINELQYQFKNISTPKQVNFVQNVSRQSDLDKISHLSNQVNQNAVIINNLGSQNKFLKDQNKFLKDQNQKYIQTIRFFESRPRQIQYIQHQINQGLKQDQRALKIQIGELSNANILLRSQNTTLKKKLANMQNTYNMQNLNQYMPQAEPLTYKNRFYEDRSTKYRKSPMPKNKGFIPNNSVSRLPNQGKSTYQNFQRKIQLLQMENDHLRSGY